MERYMGSTLYRAAREGDFHYLTSDTLWKEINVSSDTPYEERDGRRRCHFLSVTQEENNCLHIAARFGHEEFVREVLRFFPSLLYQESKKGDNPLHVAARAGHLRVVKLLTGAFQPSPQIAGKTRNSAIAGGTNEEGNETIIQNQVENRAATLTDPIDPPTAQSQSTGNSAIATGGDTILEMTTLGEAGEGENRRTPDPQSDQSTSDVTATRSISSEWASLPVWRTQNHDCSTALHEALRNKHEDVAWHLLDLEITDCESVVLVVNAKHETPLYLAAEAGFDGILNKILEILEAGGHLNNTHGNGVLDGRHITAVGPHGQTPLHAAVLANSAGCIELLHNRISGLTRKQDSYGKTALYYTAQGNSLQILRLLLELDAASAYICDNEGLSPLLVAASIGLPNSVRVILDACPASIDYSDNSGRNALHLALTNNDIFRFRRLLKMPEMMSLINEPDKEGNTLLHQATMGHKVLQVRALLNTRLVDLTAKNSDGQTPFDACTMDWELSARQPNIWRMLRRKKASRGRIRPPIRFPRWRPNIFSIKADAKDEDLIQMANTLSVVAALLATISFGRRLQYRAVSMVLPTKRVLHYSYTSQQ